MLTDSKEIEIIRNAQEPGIRDPKRPRVHFERIVKRFFSKYDFKEKKILDLGPGHYDFGKIVSAQGAEVSAIELDPAVIALGQYRGVNVFQGNLSDKEVFNPLYDSYDGLFCRGSINACWFISNEKAHAEHLKAMLSVLKKDGFAWISPCNEAPGESAEAYKNAVEFQIDFFRSVGFKVIRCNALQQRLYGIWSNAPRLIFTQNLNYHSLPW